MVVPKLRRKVKSVSVFEARKAEHLGQTRDLGIETPTCIGLRYEYEVQYTCSGGDQE